MTRLTELEPALWLTELALEEFDVRGAVILGSRAAIVWDTLAHPRDMAPVSELVTGRPVTVVYSHADWDHVWGTAGLESPVAVVAHAACLARFSSDVPETLARKQSDDAERFSGVRLVPPDTTFSTERIVEAGDLSLVLQHLPGHTLDGITGFIPERGVLLVGDAVETPFPVVGDGAVLPRWITALERWVDDPAVRVVVPAHGAVGGRDVLWNTLEYLGALAAGQVPRVPSDLAPFYGATHAENLRRTGIR